MSWLYLVTLIENHTAIKFSSPLVQLFHPCLRGAAFADQAGVCAEQNAMLEMRRDVVLRRNRAHIFDRNLQTASYQRFTGQQLSKLSGFQQEFFAHVAAAYIVKVAPRVIGKVG